MRITNLTQANLIVLIVLLLILAPNAHGQLWLEFAHPNQPHPGVNGSITIPELFADPNAIVQWPTLVVLMEFSDVAHRTPDHDLAFWRDEVFGSPRPGTRPSFAEIMRENSNGRLSIVPAIAGDRHGAKDGVVGWVATQWSSDPTQHSPEQGRAEAIRVADPFFDYFLYDNDNDGLVTARELLVLYIWAQNACCDHNGHINPPGCLPHAGGRARATDPAQVLVDQDMVDNLRVEQIVAGFAEGAAVGLMTHELGHTLLNLGDLYLDGNMRADSSFQQVWDGYFFKSQWYPPPPDIYSWMGFCPSDYIPHLDPWAKIHLGFVKPLVATHDGSYTLYDLETVRDFSAQNNNPEALIIFDPLRTNPYNEYFILENRNQALLSDQGLAVWLINETTNNSRKVVRLIRRGGHWAAMNQCFWDHTNETDGYDLTATSSPRNTSWTDGSPSYIEVYDISAAGPIMTFKVRMPPIFVDRANTGSEDGSQTHPHNTVLEGVSAIPEPPRTIRIAGGSYPETMVINTPCTLMGWKNGNVVIGE